MFPGRIVNSRYRVVRVLGRGGMGVVCEAERLDTGEHVALKFLRNDVDSDIMPAERFAREARLATRLDHPHACKILGVDEWELGPFIVLELLEGRPLSAVLVQGAPLSWSQAVRIAYEACLALGKAHALGIVHRDLKPGNLFLAWATQQRAITKVLDFGVAKIPPHMLTMTGGPSLTDATVLLGTPAYVAPEQLTNSKLVDCRADVWALGVILYEMLSGQLPFTNPFVPKLLVMIAKDAPVPLANQCPELPAGLSDLVHRCLSKERAARFADAHELALALEPYQSDGDHLLSPLLEQASLRSLPTASPPPEGLDWTEDERVAPTSRHDPMNSLEPHTTANRRFSGGGTTPRFVAATGIVAAAMAGVVGYLYTTSRFGIPEHARAQSVAISAPSEPRPRPANTTADATSTAHALAQRSLTLEAVPVTATLILDGVRLARNPAELSLADDGREHVLRAQAEGYRRGERRFYVSDATTVRVSLEPLPVRASSKQPLRESHIAKPSPPGAPTTARRSAYRSLDATNPY